MIDDVSSVGPPPPPAPPPPGPSGPPPAGPPGPSGGGGGGPPPAAGSGSGGGPPPAPTPADAPTDPFIAGGTISDVEVTQAGYVYFNLTIPTTTSGWNQVYTYRGAVTAAQQAQLAAAGYSPQSLEDLSPPPTVTCQAASNQSTNFPTNMNQFQEEFPDQYAKFMQAFEMGVFTQVNNQQNTAMQQMKSTMQEMSQD